MKARREKLNKRIEFKRELKMNYCIIMGEQQ